ncbi:MAG: ABC-F family ATP-binding cassette domain-containing protein [Ruminococcaceae bacterium]|nr:ABC-F family ATP-binding cassette domain-containing protein [Oscillospiraceae bacterium]
MIAISTDNLSLSFGTKKILEGVTFSADETDRIGIVGVNGCGKSTLFRLILGEYEADTGSIYLSKDKTVGILRQDDAFCEFEGADGEATCLEVMYRSFPELLRMEKNLSELEAMLHENANTERSTESVAQEYSALNDRFIREGGLEFRNRCASTLMRMGFDEKMMERPFSSLSGGQRTRLALSKELCREPDILMLDEPTNHLDMETLVWLESFLASYKKCILVISHDRYFLDRVTNKTLFIENTRAKLYNGGYTKSSAQRKIDREIEEKHYKNQQKEIARQEAYIAQQRAWNRERNIIAAESRLKMLEKMEKLERPKEAPKSVRIRFSSSIASGNDVLTVKNLSFSYPNGKKLLGGLSFLVKRNDRLFIVGPNGCGKSTLIKLMLGKLQATEGYIEGGYNVNIGYYDQENQNLSPENTVLDELWNAYPSLTELTIRNTLAQFRFVGEDVYKTVSDLSGGERARLTLSKLILSEMNLLILDEPTNHLDIDSREALETALEDFDGTIITVSHDRYFIDKLATRIIDLHVGGGASDFHVQNVGSGYDELTRDRKRRENLSANVGEEEKSVTKESSQKEQYLQNKQKAADARKAQKRLEKLEAESKKIEAELEELDVRMNGEAATDYVLLAELDNRKNELEERLLEIYEEIDI